MEPSKILSRPECDSEIIKLRISERMVSALKKGNQYIRLNCMGNYWEGLYDFHPKPGFYLYVPDCNELKLRRLEEEEEERGEVSKKSHLR